jgi:RNA polymerase sigma factor (sigma-70 family)
LQKAHPYKEIIDGCILNQRKAQEQLYQKFFESMMSLCLRYTKNQPDAMEVMQNGFLKVFKNIATYKPEVAGLYTWIRSIMVNTAIDFVRKKNKLQAFVDLESIDTPAVPVDIIEKMDASELLMLIQKLPPATQLVFNLYVIDGFSHREIAVMCHISEGTSKWHLSDGRRILKELINCKTLKHG